MSDYDLIISTETWVLRRMREAVEQELDWCARFGHYTVAMFWKWRLNLAFINAELARRLA